MIPVPETPDLVAAALHNALELGYVTTTRNETGRLLATLAGSMRGPIGECEAGCGAGAAWLRLGARARTHVVTVDDDEDRCRRVRGILEGLDVEVIHGGWPDLMERGPFGLLSMPIRIARATPIPDIVHAVRRGGIILIDDMPPSFGFPPRTIDGGVDHTRLAWRTEPSVNCTEIQLAEDMAAIIACRLR
ncbi:MAG: SAM-dependent methyltransferase [Acidipropionibacterium jensenii]|uniref:SAM-dependent methyltransferase n=1 Tax=Acidipropionibacterium jensenii TaxID=1749 RepID=UPI00110B6A71|nr:SAM-dependent methyltransferase [Acidipropionibacterium jensenii]MDN6658431.1 SAM-dependent methyltransferase [Acidipropionibacterium jensenii]QCV88677.1 SAM-dependent methyltransferase [Acidipropionibacterium jensenii]